MTGKSLEQRLSEATDFLQRQRLLKQLWKLRQKHEANKDGAGSHIIGFRAGETIHTENSYKYTVEGFRELARQASWQPVKCWTDEDCLFSLHLIESA